MNTRPHVVGPDAVVLRFAHSHEVRVPLAAITGVAAVARADYKKTLQVEPLGLALSCVGATNMVIRLRSNTPVVVMRHRAGDPVEIEVDRVMFAADDPRTAARAIEDRLPDRISG